VNKIPLPAAWIESCFADVNVLMVYAMCNPHGMTRVYKSGDGAAEGLVGATKMQDEHQNGGKTTSASLLLPAPEKPPEDPQDTTTTHADRGRITRTNVLLVWFGMNIALVIVFTSSAFFPWISNVGGTRGSEPYLAFFYPL
jgi:chitin synthase